MTVAAKFKEIPSHSCRVCREIKISTLLFYVLPFVFIATKIQKRNIKKKKGGKRKNHNVKQTNYTTTKINKLS